MWFIRRQAAGVAARSRCSHILLLPVCMLHSRFNLLVSFLLSAVLASEAPAVRHLYYLIGGKTFNAAAVLKVQAQVRRQQL